MELAQPSIGDAIQQLAQQGEKDVVVVPYFLSPGRHITQDIPALVDAAREANPDVSCTIADPIGEQPCWTLLLQLKSCSILLGHVVMHTLLQVGQLADFAGCAGIDPLMAEIIEQRVQRQLGNGQLHTGAR